MSRVKGGLFCLILSTQLPDAHIGGWGGSMNAMDGLRTQNLTGDRY